MTVESVTETPTQEITRVTPLTFSDIKTQTEINKILINNLGYLYFSVSFALAEVNLPAEGKTTFTNITNIVGARRGSKDRRYTKLRKRGEIDKIKDQYELSDFAGKDFRIYRPYKEGEKADFVLVALLGKDQVSVFVCPRQKVSKKILNLFALNKEIVESFENKIIFIQDHPRVPKQLFPSTDEERKGLPRELEEFVRTNTALSTQILTETILKSGILPTHIAEMLTKPNNDSRNNNFCIIRDKQEKLMWEITPLLPSEEVQTNFQLRVYKIPPDPNGEDHELWKELDEAKIPRSFFS